jgi:hypothetical protein
MKHSAKYLIIAAIGVLSSCTMGDKGSGKVPDSVKIDTNQKAQTAQPAQKTSDTTLIDSLQTDTAKKKH